jgi:type IV pilus assembly protein PilB
LYFIREETLGNAKSITIGIGLIDKLEEKLIEEKIITPSQLEKAKEMSLEEQEHLGSILIKLGYVTEKTLLDFLSKQLNVPSVDLSHYNIDPKVIPLASAELAYRYRFIPLFKIEDAITIAMANPLDLFALDRIKFEIGYKIKPVICLEKSVMTAINRFYPQISPLKSILEKVEQHALEFEDEEKLSKLQLQRIAEEPPVVKLVNTLINQAIQTGASDIHIEPQKDEVSVRFRIDGVLRRLPPLPKSVCLPVVSRIKILSRLDITQRRKPQDGRIPFEYEKKSVDLRISTYPTIFGEKIVIRILDLSKIHLELQDLGMPSYVEIKFRQLIQRPHGIILVTGPTGSGKSTTLHAALKCINSEGINITTIEDPVEYQVDHINQANVDEKAGLTFADALRSILRQDPDVILVGEIRDAETAQLAIRAALTGHLIFSTLHTRDAMGAITRLLDLGIEPFLVSSSLLCVLAQRLVRVICPQCKEAYRPSENILKSLNLQEKKQLIFHRGKGCPSCDNTGYKGRVAIYELLVPNKGIFEAIMAKASAEQIKEIVLKAATKTLADDGLEKALEGVTTIEEVLKVTAV